MAEEKLTPDVQRFDHQEHDVTCCIEQIFCGYSKLILGEEDAEIIKNCCLGMCRGQKRGPYGELGTVDSGHCCCFYGFAAASLMPNEEGLQCIGCGCETEKVDMIVKELKKRQALRGDRAKTRMGETTIQSLSLLHKKVDAVMASLELPPVSDEMKR